MSDPDDVLPPTEPGTIDEELAPNLSPSDLGRPHVISPDRVREDLAALADVVATGIEVDGQVVQVAASTWAIYGHAIYDGEVIVGEYPDAEEASEVLHAAPYREQPDEEQPRP